MSTTPPDYAAINAAFQALSPAEKRRAIAQDVLARVATNQLVPKPQMWVNVLHANLPRGEKADLQRMLFERPEVICEVCAIGAAICGLAALEDRITAEGNSMGAGVGLNHVFDNQAPDLLARLDALFGYEQVRTIERAFERDKADLFADDCPDQLLDEADTFYRRNPDDRARFLAIWTAILNHPEGLFDVVELNRAAGTCDTGGGA